MGRVVVLVTGPPWCALSIRCCSGRSNFGEPLDCELVGPAGVLSFLGQARPTAAARRSGRAVQRFAAVLGRPPRTAKPRQTAGKGPTGRRGIGRALLGNEHQALMLGEVAEVPHV